MAPAGREIGTLIVVVLKAKNLPNKRHIGKQDPYCSVALNGETRRTKAIKRGGQHPEWDEEIRFTLFEEVEDALSRPADSQGLPPPLPPKHHNGPPNIQGGRLMKLACHADDNREPELIGETNVDLLEVLTKGETDEWFPLSAKDKYAGEVYLELTFWSNKPPPKKPKPKQERNNTQYGGAGSFVPFNESTTSLNGLGGHRPSFRVASTSSIHEDYTYGSVPSSLRSSVRSVRTPNRSAEIDLYTPPYESNSSYSMSAVDSISSDFSELGITDVRQRRDTFPPLGGSHPPARPPSAQPFFVQVNGGGQGSYFDHVSTDSYDRSRTPSGYQAQNTTPPQTYQVPFHAGPSVPHNPLRGPRHSLPSPASGFMPMQTPTSSFMSVQNQPESSGFAPRPGPTPGPMGFEFPSSGSHHSGFAPPNSRTPAPSGFMTSSPSLSSHPTYHYPPYHNSSTTPAPYMPPSSVQSPLPPPQSYAPSLPPSSVSQFPHPGPPPRQGSYPTATPSPPHDQFPTSQVNQNESLSSSHSSRPLPLPRPQTSMGGSGRRQPSLPIPPGGGISPSHNQPWSEAPYQGGIYPPPMPYSSIPPPPPPPLPSAHVTNPAPPWNHNAEPNHFNVPPPLPLRPHQTESPPERHSLPQPPHMPLQHPQQSIYQHIPPPPTNTSSQIYFPGSGSWTPTQYPPNHGADGSYYPA